MCVCVCVPAGRVGAAARFDYNLWSSNASVAAGVSVTPMHARCAGKVAVRSTQRSDGASPALLSAMVDVAVLPGLALRCGTACPLYGAARKPANVFVEIIYGDKASSL